MSPGTLLTVKNLSVCKLLRQFTELLYTKNKTATRCLGASKSKRKEIRANSAMCSIIPKLRGYKKINEWVNEDLYNWILHHLQVLQSPIVNYLLKASIDGHS